MKNKILIVIICLFFVIGMIILNKYLNNMNETPINNTEQNKIIESKITKITNENFEEEVIKSEKTVLIDFYATWCGPCKIYSPIVEEFATENEDIKVVKLDIDEAQDIAMEYNVMSIPTTIIIKDGKEVDRAVGVISKELLSQMVK